MARRNTLAKSECPVCGRAYYYDRRGAMVARRGLKGPPGECCQPVLLNGNPAPAPKQAPRRRIAKVDERAVSDFVKAMGVPSYQESDYGEFVVERPCFPLGGACKDYPHFTIGLTTGLMWDEGTHYDLVNISENLMQARAHPAGRYHIQEGRAARLKVRLPRHCHHVRVYYNKKITTYTCMLVDQAPAETLVGAGQKDGQHA